MNFSRQKLSTEKKYILPISKCWNLFFSYEKRSEFERDVRARNVTALNRDSTSTKENTEEISVAVSSRKRQTDTAREIQIDKAPKQDHVAAINNNNNVDRPNKAVESWRKSRENARPQTVAELQPEIEKKSWRERLAEREKEEEERKAKAAAEAPPPPPPKVSKN